MNTSFSTQTQPLFGKMPLRTRAAIGIASIPLALGIGAAPALAQDAPRTTDTVQISTVDAEGMPVSQPTLELNKQKALELLQSGQVQSVVLDQGTGLLTITMADGEEASVLASAVLNDTEFASAVDTVLEEQNVEVTVEEAAVADSGSKGGGGIFGGGGLAGMMTVMLGLGVAQLFIKEPSKKVVKFFTNGVTAKQSKNAMKEKSDLKLENIEGADDAKKAVQGYVDKLSHGEGAQHFIFSGAQGSKLAVAMGHELGWPVYRFDIANYNELYESGKSAAVRGFLKTASRVPKELKKQEHAGTVLVLPVTDLANDLEERAMVKQVLNQLKRLKPEQTDRIHVVITMENKVQLPEYLSVLNPETLDIA